MPVEQIDEPVELHVILNERGLNIDFIFEEGNENLFISLLSMLFSGILYLSTCQVLEEKRDSGEITEESYLFIMQSLAMIVETLRNNQDNDDQPLMMPDEVFSPKYMPLQDLDNED